MKKITQNIYLTYYNLLIVQDLWQGHYKILPIISLKEFIKSNVNMDLLMKNVKLVELTIKIATIFLSTKTLNYDLIKCKSLCCNKKYKQKFDEKLKKRFLNTCKFSNHNSNKLILINIWMIEKNSLQYHYLKKKIFTVI